MLYFIPEVSEGLINVTDEQIDASTLFYTGCRAESLATIQKLIKNLKIIFTTMRNWRSGTNAVSMTTVRGASGTKPVYIEMIETIMRDSDVQGNIPFQVDSAADAEELLQRIFTLLTCSSLPFLQDLKQKVTYFIKDIIQCKDKSMGRNGLIFSREDSSTMLGISITKMNADGKVFYDPTILSIQAGIDKAQEEDRTFRDMLIACAVQNESGVEKKGESEMKQLVFSPSPYTKYIFVNTNRKVNDFSTGGSKVFTDKVVVDKRIRIGSQSYKIKGAICHGSYHYWYYNFKDGEVVAELNDSTVSQRTTAEVRDTLDTQARLLLYERDYEGENNVNRSVSVGYETNDRYISNVYGGKRRTKKNRRSSKKHSTRKV
jgi:hypothetical protein